MEMGIILSKVDMFVKLRIIKKNEVYFVDRSCFNSRRGASGGRNFAANSFHIGLSQMAPKANILNPFFFW